MSDDPQHGRYVARHARSDDDVRAAQRLRSLAFTGVNTDLDHDRFDTICTHVLIEDTCTQELVCCFRLMPFDSGRDIGRSYAAQYYELSALEGFAGSMVEMGRFCVHPDRLDPDILRVAWGAMAAYVDDNGYELLFGCSSFSGTDAQQYLDVFAMLRDRYLAPKHWLPKVKAADVFRFTAKLCRTPDIRLARLRMPPLLRTYLLMGGWVSDHAVVDRDLNTLHVFTGLEMGRIPAARKRALRALATSV